MENTDEKNEEYQSGTMKQWIQDNLRILISVFIVVLIAGGIYSYSRRSEETPTDRIAEENSILEEIAGTGEEQASDSEQKVEEGEKKADQQASAQDKTISSTATSQETKKSFIESAVKGDGTTHLARRALAHHLEKNSDSALTKEHKIYIEDYLRKNISHKGSVRVGTSVEFEKSLISEAIAKSKTLNENQLKNLQKYSARVANL